MSLTPRHRGYIGKMTIDPEHDVIQGEIVGIRDVVTFEGGTVAEAVKAFRESVDEYLALCRERGEKPDRPMRGQFLVRADPELHRRISIAAELRGQSVNTWVVDHLTEDAERELSRS